MEGNSGGKGDESLAININILHILDKKMYQNYRFTNERVKVIKIDKFY